MGGVKFISRRLFLAGYFSQILRGFFAQILRRFFAQILHKIFSKIQAMETNEITFLIRGAAFRVHAALGPGLLESVYEAALKYELENQGLQVCQQVSIPMIYKEIKFDLGFRLDLLVENQVIVEIKSIESLNEVHFKQVLTYLRLSDKQIGLLINFNVKSLEDKISLKRIANTFT